MRRIGQIVLVGVRSYQLCIGAHEAGIVVRLPEFNSHASLPGYTTPLAFTEINFLPYAFGYQCSSLYGTPAKGMLYPP